MTDPAWLFISIRARFWGDATGVCRSTAIPDTASSSTKASRVSARPDALINIMGRKNEDHSWSAVANAAGYAQMTGNSETSQITAQQNNISLSLAANPPSAKHMAAIESEQKVRSQLMKGIVTTARTTMSNIAFGL